MAWPRRRAAPGSPRPHADARRGALPAASQPVAGHSPRPSDRLAALVHPAPNHAEHHARARIRPGHRDHRRLEWDRAVDGKACGTPGREGGARGAEPSFTRRGGGRADRRGGGGVRADETGVAPDGCVPLTRGTIDPVRGRPGVREVRATPAQSGLPTGSASGPGVAGRRERSLALSFPRPGCTFP